MSLFYVLSDEVVFDMSEWIGKNYIWDITPDHLVNLIQQYYKTHKLLFVCHDGENPTLSGLIHILETQAKELAIPKHQIELAIVAPLSSDYVSITQINPLLFAYPLSEYWHEIRNSEFDKKFIGLYNRPTLYRLRAAMFLNKLDSTMVSYIKKDETLYALRRLTNHYPEEIQWVNAVAPINQLEDVSITHTGLIDWKETTELMANSYHRYFIEFSVETDYTNPFFLTEKTFRSFVFGKPFLLFSGKGALANLRNFGFKTFSPYINESYDLIDNHEERFVAITKEIERLNALSIEDLKQMAVDMYPIFDYNRKIIRNQKMQINKGKWGPWADTKRWPWSTK